MEEIGVRLRSARESKGISLEGAEEDTKIRRKYIEALEDGRNADLPGEVYAKGFLRTYGNYLGLDGASLVEQYKGGKGDLHGVQRAAAADDAEPVQPGAAHLGGAGREPKPLPATPRPRPARGKARGGIDPVTRRKTTTAVVLVAVVAVIGYLGWKIAMQFDTQIPPASSNPAPTPPAPTPPTPAPPPKLPDPPKVSMTRGAREDVVFTVPAKEVNVRLEIPPGERLWMQAFVDEKMVFDGFPKEPLDLKGPNVRLRMGHMNGVSLVINGQRFDKPLESGPYTLIIKGEQ